MAHVLQKTKEYLITHDEVRIGRLEDYKIKKLIAKRKKNIPLAYITGQKEFYGLNFLVNTSTLVPRPDTEILVENVLKEIASLPHQRETKLLLIDVGTGSGCIPISILKNIQNQTIQTCAIDISKKALKVAKQNAKKHGGDITFLHGNLLEPISKIRNSLFVIHNSPIIITANLPYLTQEQFDEEPSIQHEPHSALVAQDQGLSLYKELLKQIHEYIPSSHSLICFFEIDPAQAPSLSEYIHLNFPKTHTEIHKDLSGNDRIIKITF